jgi:hypothetical protein
MQLLASRDYPVIDYQMMGEFIGHERLFERPTARSCCTCYRKENSKRGNGSLLTVRDAISWLNGAPDEFGSFWEYAMASPPEQTQIQQIGSTF